MVEVALSCNMNCLTIGPTLQNKDKIMEHVASTVPKKSAVISEKHHIVIEEMETLCRVWMQDQHQRQIPLSLRIIQEKAKRLLEDLEKE